MAELVTLWPWLLIAFLVSLVALVGTLILAIGYLPFGAPWPIEAAAARIGRNGSRCKTQSRRSFAGIRKRDSAAVGGGVYSGVFGVDVMSPQQHCPFCRSTRLIINRQTGITVYGCGTAHDSLRFPGSEWVQSDACKTLQNKQQPEPAP